MFILIVSTFIWILINYTCNSLEGVYNYNFQFWLNINIQFQFFSFIINYLEFFYLFIYKLYAISSLKTFQEKNIKNILFKRGWVFIQPIQILYWVCIHFYFLCILFIKFWIFNFLHIITNTIKIINWWYTKFF